MQRSRLGSEVAVLATAAVLSGCASLLDLDRFRIDDEDAGGRDAAAHAPDAGRDACTPTTHYEEADGDGYGDPASSRELCAPMSGWVDNADDCDDEAGAIHPGADELCDDVDQDCDGAVDEGLIGPLGDWIEVVPDVGEGTTFAAVVAHQDGFVVAWHLPSDPAVRASFFDRDGVPIATDVFVQGYGTTERAVIRYSEDGLDQVLFAWIEADGIFTRLCSTTGACATSPPAVFEGPTSGFGNLALAQLENRAIVAWETPDGLSLRSIAPRTGVVSDIVVIPVVEGATRTTFSGFATANGPVPHMLTYRSAATFDGTMIIDARMELIRIDGAAAPVFDAARHRFEWDARARCAALGFDPCFTAVIPFGTGRIGSPTLAAFEALFDGTRNSLRLIGLEPAAEGAPRMTATHELATAREVAGFDVRGTVLTAVINTTVDLALQDLPLSDAATGGTLVRIPGLDSSSSYVHGLSMHRARGAIIARTDTSARSLSMLRLGCEP